MPSIAQIDLIETALAKSRAVPSAQAPVEDRGESKLVGSGSLVRAIQALRAAEVCIMRTIETREEEPEIAGRVLKIALENIETATLLRRRAGAARLARRLGGARRLPEMLRSL